MAAYNEAKYISNVIDKASRYASQVLVVDDGSTDNTADVVRLSKAILIQHRKKKGKGSAVQTLLDETRKRSPDVLVLMDADLQHSPNEIPDLVKPIVQGYDLVIGSRQSHAGKTPYYRRIGLAILFYLSWILAGKKINDSQCGFRALSKKAVSELKLKENGFAIETEMIAEAVERNLRITEVPIANIDNGDGLTLHIVNHGFEVLFRSIVMIIRKKPYILLWIILGILIAISITLLLTS